MVAFRIQIEGGVRRDRSDTKQVCHHGYPDGPRALCVTWQLRSTYMFAIYFYATRRDGYSFQMVLCAFCLLTLVHAKDTLVLLYFSVE